MIIRKAEYLTTAVSRLQYPPADKPEIAFVGRSNVGKSSLINNMLNRKGLARISSKPGKTRTINFYNINDLLYFVDLPGYGYAQVSKEEKARWGKIIEEYLHTRQNVTNITLLVDIRHEPTEDDKLMYNWIKTYKHNIAIAANKADKISRGQYNKHMSIIKKSLQVEDNDKIVTFSSEASLGRDELWAFYDSLLGIDEPFKA